MTERTGDDADDLTDRTERQLDGSLTDELGSRTLAYRRALERHAEVIQLELAVLQSHQYAPQDYRQSTRLPLSWRQVREAATLMGAASDAVREHRATRH